MDNIKITADGFVWLIVTDVAEKLYYSNAMQVYRLYDDGTEALINNFRDLQDALAAGNDIGVEIAPLPSLIDSYQYQLDKAAVDSHGYSKATIEENTRKFLNK